MNLSCGNCKTIQSFSGDPPKCDVCGWICYPGESPDTGATTARPLTSTVFDDDYERVDDTAERVDDAAARIERALERVEAAIKDRLSTAQMLGILAIVALAWSVLGAIWHSKWRYAAEYSVRTEDVYVQSEPHDCAFFAAPLGGKYCHYERTVSTVRWAT